MAASCRRPSDPPDLNFPVVLPSSIDRLPLEQSTNITETLTSRSALHVPKERLDSQFSPTSDLKGKGLLDPSSSVLRGNDANSIEDLPDSSNLIFGTLDRDILVSRNSTNPGDTVSLGDKHVEDMKNPKTSFINAWSRPQRIKINFDTNSTVMSSDGLAVKLNTELEITNSKILQNSIVLKVLGKNIPFSTCSIELRKQWNRFGNLHLTSLGMNWILCSFKTTTAMEVLSGGPWYIGGHIIGLDKWSPSFSPLSLKGLTAPVWICFPHLPLHCWDETNIAMIASRIGTPLFFDGNSFSWSKMEFARVCVRINLENKLPSGIWVDGLGGRFFQKVEYEKLSSFCYNCAKIGHLNLVCLDLLSATGTSKSPAEVTNEESHQADQSDYGPWMHVKFKKRSRQLRNRGTSFRNDEKTAGTSGNTNHLDPDNSFLNKTDDLPHQSIAACTDLKLTRSSDILDNIIETTGRISIPLFHLKLPLFGILDDITDSNTDEKSGRQSFSDLDKVIAGKNETHLFSSVTDQATDPISIPNCLKTLDCSGIDQNDSDTLLSAEVPIDNNAEGIVEVSISKSVKQKAKPQLKFLGPIEPISRKRKVEGKLRKKGGDSSPLVVFGALTTPNKGIWHVAMVYGHKDFQFRRDLWNCLDKVMITDVPTIMGGDINCLLSAEDKRGGKRFKLTKGTEEMKTFMLKDELQNDILKLQLQEDEAGGLNPEDLDTLCSKVREYNVTLVRLSTWWNQRAKAKWNEDGDTNSRFYHTYATARKNDKWKPRSCNIQNWPDIDHKQKLDIPDIDRLISGFSETEFFNAVSQLGSNKSPGLDGSTSSFFKFYWDIIKDTTWRAINHFFTTGRMNGAWKDTLIVLIPKINNPVTPSNFRPISLCQTIYKIATSMIVNRLKIFIPKLITEEQVAYVPGRSMSDHCLLALEIFNKFRISKNKKGLMAIKLDMAQAFDSMCWKTLENVLHWFGFPESFSNLILECVTGVRFSILLNGKGTRWIEAKSGFRQGCPMSPYLFIMCSQLLSSLIQQRGLQIGIHTSNRAPKITHLLYADDVLLFGKSSVSQLRVMMNLIKEYCGWTGQGVNQSKSQIIFGSSTNQSMKRKIGKKTGFKIVKEFHYLGIKIALRRLTKNDFQFVIDHALDKLNSWGAQFLSMAGRIILAKSSLLSLPTFVSTHSLIPKKILYDLDRICRDFIWHQNKDNKGLHYFAWDDLCTPRNRGGLGMHSSVKRVGPLRARLAWRFYQNPSSLLFKCLTGKQATDIWNGKAKQGHSAARSIIANGVSFLKSIIRWKIANGANINVMDDTWLLDKNFNKWPMLADCIGLENLTLQNFLKDNNYNFINFLHNSVVKNAAAGQDTEKLYFLHDFNKVIFQHTNRNVHTLGLSNFGEVIGITMSFFKISAKLPFEEDASMSFAPPMEAFKGLGISNTKIISFPLPKIGNGFLLAFKPPSLMTRGDSKIRKEEIRLKENLPFESNMNGLARTATTINNQFKEKPLLIKEGGMLNNRVVPVVFGKGKEAIKKEEFLSLKKFKPAVGFKEMMENINVEASTSAGKKSNPIRGFKSTSLPTSPISCKIVDSGSVENKKANVNKVIEDFPLLLDIQENLDKGISISNDDSNKKEESSTWTKKQSIRVDNLNLGSFLSEDGRTVQLHAENEISNAKNFNVLLW
ncbi:hypothetical protein KFK09_003982 [Dendrobium nobile]|uniref:Reverse transcriptase domain-containing protein n=1 Tax=Dendrobium nobile TaxID=94219 RepID=A0A8T3C436_DENNO|nr:hypothetical protein KFK09_003982 [Dendrobium nobile]